MTAAQAAHGEPSAVEDPVSGDGVRRVFRAGRDETAGSGKQRRDQPLVRAEEREDDSFSESIFNSCASSSIVARGAPGRARMHTSRAGPGFPSRRTISRSRRLTRLRWTAGPTLFGTDSPHRERPSALSSAKSTSHRPATRFPFFWHSVKSRRFRSRKSFGKASGRENGVRPSGVCGLCGGGRKERRAPSSCSSATENHGFSCAGGCWVGTCASWSPRPFRVKTLIL